MITKERIKQLEDYVAGWEVLLANSNEELAQLFKLKGLDVNLQDHTGKDILDERILAQDNAVRQYSKALLFSQSQLGRAQNGEDI